MAIQKRYVPRIYMVHSQACACSPVYLDAHEIPAVVPDGEGIAGEVEGFQSAIFTQRMPELGSAERTEVIN